MIVASRVELWHPRASSTSPSIFDVVVASWAVVVSAESQGWYMAFHKEDSAKIIPYSDKVTSRTLVFSRTVSFAATDVDRREIYAMEVELMVVCRQICRFACCGKHGSSSR